MFTRLDYSIALEYSIIGRYTHIIYYYHNTVHNKCVSVNIIIESNIVYNKYFATGVYKKKVFKIVYSNGFDVDYQI